MMMLVIVVFGEINYNASSCRLKINHERSTDPSDGVTTVTVDINNFPPASITGKVVDGQLVVDSFKVSGAINMSKTPLVWSAETSLAYSGKWDHETGEYTSSWDSGGEVSVLTETPTEAATDAHSLLTSIDTIEKAMAEIANIDAYNEYQLDNQLANLPSLTMKEWITREGLVVEGNTFTDAVAGVTTVLTEAVDSFVNLIKANTYEPTEEQAAQAAIDAAERKALKEKLAAMSEEEYAVFTADNDNKLALDLLAAHEVKEESFNEQAAKLIADTISWIGDIYTDNVLLNEKMSEFNDAIEKFRDYYMSGELSDDFQSGELFDIIGSAIKSKFYELAKEYKDGIIDTANDFINDLKKYWPFGDDESPDIDDAEATKSPVALDLDGDGIETTELGNYFDHDNDGFKEKTAWVGVDDGLLAMDLNGDGEITSGLELFGDSTKLASGETADDGYQALDDLDSNEDGILSAADDAWQNLQVWQDANGNASVDGGELKTLDEWNIQSLNLSAQSSNLIDENNNEHSLTSTMTMTDGSERTTTDVWFQVDRAQRIQQAVDLPDDIEALPDARGFGTVADLRYAMAENATLQSLVEQYVAETDPDVRHKMIEPLIFEWAGVSDVDPYSRDPSRIYPHVMDARQLETLEALVGRGYEGTWCWGEKDPNPHGQAAPKLIAEFEEFASFFEAQLLAQTEYKDAFDWIYSDFNTAGKNIFADFSQFESMIISLGSNGELSEAAEIVSVVKGLGTYSSYFREQMEESFSSLTSQNPEMAYIFNYSLIKGTNAAETLQGSNRDEVLDGKAGDDLLYGYAGDDIYNFAQGHGSDFILDSSGTDTIYLGEGFTPENVRLSRNATSVWIERLDENGETTGDSIQIDNFYNFDGTLDSPIESIVFDSNIHWDLEQIQSKFIVTIDEGDNGIYASQIGEQIDALAGDDIVWGYGGDDQLLGNTGNDELNGGEGNDILIGGSGDDNLTGGNGADLYLFSAGHGKDTINNYDRDSNSADSIHFDQSISEKNITLRREGDDLLINGKSDDQICVKSFFNESAVTPYAIDSIQFSDGTVWDKSFILDAVKIITKKNDFVIGYDQQDELIDGLAGDDTIYGRSGNDTLLGNKGSDNLYGEEGNDEIDGGVGNDNLYGGSGSDRLSGGNGNDLLNGDDGDDYLSGGNGEDTLSGERGHDNLIGGNGNDYLSGGRGDDTLDGGRGDDYLSGGTGNDYLNGGNGDDIYHFSQGDGQDHINDNEGDLSIYLSNLDPANAVFRRQGCDLMITFAGNTQADAIYLTDWFDSSTFLACSGFSIGLDSSNIQYFSPHDIDTATFTGSENSDQLWGNVKDNIIAGLAGDDNIYGDSGDDTLNGGLGNDHLYGGDGDDSYQFALGDGHDTINNFSNIAGETDQLVFADDIAKDDIWLTRSGEDLVIDLSGSDDQVTVDDWFVDEAHQIDEIHAGNNVLLSSNVNTLISAMAGFDNPAAGNVDISSQVKDEITPSIVAVWQAA